MYRLDLFLYIFYLYKRGGKGYRRIIVKIRGVVLVCVVWFVLYVDENLWVL